MAENPFKIIAKELPKFLQEMGVPFLGKDKPRGSVMDPDPNVEKQTIENALTAMILAAPSARLMGALLKNPVTSGAGAVALTGDPLAAIPGKAGIAMLEGSGNAEAAFRSKETSSIPRRMIDSLMRGTDVAALDQIRAYWEPSADTDLALQAVANKLTKKEMAKYGTEEFVLDKYLRSTTALDGRMPPSYDKLTVKDILRDQDSADIGMLNAGRAGMSDSSKESAAIINSMILKKADLIEDFTKAQKEGKDLIASESDFYPSMDIAAGLRAMVGKAREFGVPEDQIAGKTLPALHSIIQKGEDKALKELQASVAARDEAITSRTQELMSVDTPIAKGFTKLKTVQDLSDETCVLNHCVGSIGMDNNRYIPAFDPVTGKPHKWTSDTAEWNASSASEYEKRMENGHEYYSYRPEGIPEFTVEVSEYEGKKYITQSFGTDNKPVTPDDNPALKSFMDELGIEEFRGDY